MMALTFCNGLYLFGHSISLAVHTFVRIKSQMTRPADHTRQSIMKAAARLFAEKGYQGASVRDIVTRARVNQAAINYHFKGKDGLYLELLKAAFEKLTEQAGLNPEKLKLLSARRPYKVSCISS
jgi:AcrR family transcriptional regulator